MSRIPSECLHSRDLSLWDCRSHLIWANQRHVEPEFQRTERPFSRGARMSCWLIRRGRVEIHEPDGGVTRAGRGMWLLPGDVTQRRYFSPQCQLVSIHFYFNLLDGRPVYTMEKSLTFFREAFPELERTAEVLVSTVTAENPGNDIPVD